MNSLACDDNGDKRSVDICCYAPLEPEHLAVKLMP